MKGLTARQKAAFIVRQADQEGVVQLQPSAMPGRDFIGFLSLGIV
jgi:hypothetical protein